MYTGASKHTLPVVDTFPNNGERKMTPEITEHLVKVENAVQATKPLLSRYGYPDDSRTVIVIGLIDQMIEHHEIDVAADSFGTGWFSVCVGTINRGSLVSRAVDQLLCNRG